MKSIRCLVSAGPTREHLDPVRFISNPSTGKMGVSIACAAAALGWNTTLVLGPTQIDNPEGVETLNVISADEMLEALGSHFDDCDILIMTAAVSDMRPKFCHAQKVKKSDIAYNLEFEQTPDILKTLSLRKTSQKLVGFAAETENLETYARKKLVEKDLDCIVANLVCQDENSGFASDTNAVRLIMRSGEIIDFSKAPKEEIAKQLCETFSKKFF